MDEVCIVRAVPCRCRGIQKVKVSRRVGCPDVQQKVGGAALVWETGGLEDVPGHLVNRRVSVGAERAIHSRCPRWNVGQGVYVGEPIGALVPLCATVGARSDQVVVLDVDQRRLAGVGGEVLNVRRWVVNRQPRAVGSSCGAVGAAAGDALHHGGSPVRGGGGSVADERVKINKVLLAGAIEVDVSVPAAWGIDETRDPIRW